MAVAVAAVGVLYDAVADVIADLLAVIQVFPFIYVENHGRIGCIDPRGLLMLC